MSDTTPTPKPKKKTTPRQRREAAAAAAAGGYVDRNFDFIPDKDQLSREELAAQYQSVVGIIYSVPELQGLFEQALDEGWTPTRLQSAVQNSNWFRDNSESARIAWAQEQTGGADWQQSLNDAQRAVQARARQIGASITPEQAAALARRFIYENWGSEGRGGLLDEALAQDIRGIPDSRGVANLRGQAGDLQQSLRSLATANGVFLTDNWYQSVAQSVAMGLSSAEDWERDVREQAASYWPVYADKIRAGVNVYDLASPYIRTMAQEFEIDPSQITLENPYIRQALTGMDEQGNPTTTNLWDFQKKLRQDPRWQNTAKAQNEVTSTVGRIMQMFGFMGG